ncbi:MAG: beta-lactamase family protein [Acidobacteriota bacterium]|nr:beta-lactamase family protein [Acidobacteriota bacterium]
MNLKRKLILALFCLALPIVSLAQNNQTLPSAKVEKIEAAIAAWMTQHKAPALSVAIVTDNKLIWSKGFGQADVENKVAARSDTVYRLASISKSITAIAVMQLVEKGKIDLDAPVQKYCAAYPEKQWTITPRHLLVHFAGVRHNKLEEVFSTKHYNTIAEAVGAFKDDALLHEPESKYFYSTPGYILLGCAIEGASGASYLDYVRENIFKPAGMIQTQADNVYKIIPNRVAGYRKTLTGEIQNAPLHDTSIKIPGGGMVSTAEDLARFAVAVGNGQLLKPETLAQMWTKPKTRDGKESNYAFGFLIGMDGEQRRVFNDGSQAGTRTYLFILPKEKFAVALMTNLEKAWCEELAPKIVEAVLKDR